MKGWAAVFVGGVGMGLLATYGPGPRLSLLQTVVVLAVFGGLALGVLAAVAGLGGRR